jgi:hypothetical protein
VIDDTIKKCMQKREIFYQRNHEKLNAPKKGAFLQWLGFFRIKPKDPETKGHKTLRTWGLIQEIGGTTQRARASDSQHASKRPFDQKNESKPMNSDGKPNAKKK